MAMTPVRRRRTGPPALSDLRWRTQVLPLVDDGRAACRNENPDLWFPLPDDRRGARSRTDNRTIRAVTAQAVAICHRCPIRRACLQWALDTDTRHGIYGGLTEADRAKLTGKRPL